MYVHILIPDSKVHGANMGPTWVLSAPDGPHIGPMNLVIMVALYPTHVSAVFFSSALSLVYIWTITFYHLPCKTYEFSQTGDVNKILLTTYLFTWWNKYEVWK